MKVIDRKIVVADTPSLSGPCDEYQGSITIGTKSEESTIYNIAIQAEAPMSGELLIRWKLPCHKVKGVWSTNALHEKRLRADWELPKVRSRISVDAPIICIYDHEDSNVITFALSDFINTTELEASIQEEDGCIYCIVRLLVEPLDFVQNYQCQLLVIDGPLHFSEAITIIGDWWAQSIDTAHVPEQASVPVYSTWYSYHQNFTAEDLTNECIQAKSLGYEGIIVDDGWQTVDGGRGYDYTGDWEVERIPDIHAFVEKVHDLGMYCMFWMSVPFCGMKSKAYQVFAGKFLTEKHPWAPVFDPRYPDVRAHLVSRYKEAVGIWKLDGLKLDFIDDFKVYPDTDLSPEGGKDCLSVNEGVKRLIDDIKTALYAINPEVLIEFRQKYTGPYLQTVGNMFRAFDCPYDSLTNRIRTTDVKLLADTTIVHSDMIAWHEDEDVEHAALQLTSILYSVPQLSVRLDTLSESHKKMVKYLTSYWKENRSVLLEGGFMPERPSSNYSILTAANDDKIIYGLYDDVLLEVDDSFSEIDIINGKMTEQVVFEVVDDLMNVDVVITDCQGSVDWKEVVSFEEGIHALEVPANGIIMMKVNL